MNAVDIIAESWREIKDSNMNGVWKKLWPECVNDFKDFPKRDPIIKVIVDLANCVGYELEEADVYDLLDSHGQELSNKDLMELNQDKALP